MITHRIKNIVILVLFVLLAVSASLNFIQVRNAKQEQLNAMLRNEQANTAIAASRALAKSYADRAREVDSVRTLERDSAKVVVRALKDETRAYKKTIATLRPLVAARIDSVPVLRDFVAAQDSTILKQDSTIVSLEEANANEVGRAAEMDQLKRKEIGELVSMINGLQENLVDEQDKARKAERKAKKRFGLAVNAGYGVMSTGGEIRTGPTVNAGLSYRLLRF